MDTKREVVSNVIAIKRLFLTFDFEEFAVLTSKFELVTIGFMLGLTVAFVEIIVVDEVTRFFVLFPV
jgi:hypothetical protein